MRFVLVFVAGFVVLDWSPRVEKRSMPWRRREKIEGNLFMAVCTGRCCNLAAKTKDRTLQGSRGLSVVALVCFMTGGTRHPRETVNGLHRLVQLGRDHRLSRQALRWERVRILLWSVNERGSQCEPALFCRRASRRAQVVVGRGRIAVASSTFSTDLFARSTRHRWEDTIWPCEQGTGPHGQHPLPASAGRRRRKVAHRKSCSSRKTSLRI